MVIRNKRKTGSHFQRAVAGERPAAMMSFRKSLWLSCILPASVGFSYSAC